MLNVISAAGVYGVAGVPQPREGAQRDEHPPVFDAPALVYAPGDIHAHGRHDEADCDKNVLNDRDA